MLAQPVRVCVATGVPVWFWLQKGLKPVFRRPVLVAGSEIACLRLLDFAAQVPVADQVVGDRCQRPFDRGCRLPSALELPHPTLFL